MFANVNLLFKFACFEFLLRGIFDIINATGNWGLWMGLGCSKILREEEGEIDGVLV